MNRSLTMTTAALLTGLVLAVTACGNQQSGGGGQDPTGGAAGGSGGSGQDSGKEMDDAIKLRQCLRKEGVDIPDPKPGEDARGMTVGKDVDPDKMKKAMDACGGGGGAGSQGITQEMKDKALKQAQCLRGKGFNVPDPTFEGDRMTGLGVPEGVDQKAFMDAANACSKG
ncbi:hypothetical protein ACWGF3_00325 [Streptomyces xanthophaeus]|nr:hypothetical protein [Streptomyces xanthophaeus]